MTYSGVIDTRARYRTAARQLRNSALYNMDLPLSLQTHLLQAG